MREIFTDLYKKVLGFFQTQEEEKTENAKEVAVNRMKLVLMQDRTNLTPFLLEKMRGEMIEVLAKYVEMDKEALELNFEQEGEQMALMLSIPVIRAKEEDEIQAALEAEEQAKSESSEEVEESDEEASEVEEESEDEEEEIAAEAEEETCSEPSEVSEELSESPDEVEEIEEESSVKKSKKRK